MKNRVWVNLMMAALIAGLFLTFSCSKTTLVAENPQIQDQSQTQDGMDADEEARLRAQRLREQMEREKQMAQAKAMEAKTRFENQDVLFEYDSAALTSEAKLLLQEKAAWMKANSTVSIKIEGHCDERGTTEYNLALGERRATAAKSYLVNLGVAASRISMISLGEEQPVDTAQTEAAYRKNRRAHFVIK